MRFIGASNYDHGTQPKIGVLLTNLGKEKLKNWHEATKARATDAKLAAPFSLHE